MELLIVVAIIGILAAIAIPNILVAIQRAKQKRTMADIKTISLAWETRAADYGQYNAAGAGLLGASNPIFITDVEVMVTPTYVKSIPHFDGWNHPFNIYLDQPLNGARAETYVIVSAGKDGIFDSNPATGAISNFDCDIIFSNGQFVSFPPQ